MTKDTTTSEHATTPARKGPQKGVKYGKPKARANGEGAVYRERQTDLWVAAIRHVGEDDKRRLVRQRFKTQGEALKGLKALRKRIDDGHGVGDARMTVKAFLEKWLRECVEGPTSTLRTSTRVSYATLVNKHLVPGLGHHAIAKLTAMHVHNFINGKLNERDEDGEPVLSSRTVQYIHAVLRAALKQAEAWDLVTSNVARKVKAPSPGRREAKALTTEQVGALLVKLKGDRLFALFAMAVSMGLRRGELCGLTWANVDLDAGIVRVRQQLQRVRHVRDESKAIVETKGLMVSELKTERSRRTLRIPAMVLEALRVHATLQDAEKKKAGGLWIESGFVFTAPDGGALDGRLVLERWHDALDDAGIPAMPFHSSRHTAASALLAHGASIHAVKENHGHSQIALTANTYAHLVDELRDATATTADSALRAAMESATPR